MCFDFTRNNWSSIFIFSGKAICQFKPGSIKSDSEANMGITNTPSECAALVRIKRPDANGAVWDYGSDRRGQCKAKIGSYGNIRETGNWIGCLFSSTYLKFIHNIHISKYLIKF